MAKKYSKQTGDDENDKVEKEITKDRWKNSLENGKYWYLFGSINSTKNTSLKPTKNPSAYTSLQSTKMTQLIQQKSFRLW